MEPVGGRIGGGRARERRRRPSERLASPREPAGGGDEGLEPARARSAEGELGEGDEKEEEETLRASREPGDAEGCPPREGGGDRRGRRRRRR